MGSTYCTVDEPNSSAEMACNPPGGYNPKDGKSAGTYSELGFDGGSATSDDIMASDKVTVTSKEE